MHSYKKNKHNHNVFQTREHSNEINRKNERLFVRLQEIHSVSVLHIETVTNLCIFFVSEKEKGV